MRKGQLTSRELTKGYLRRIDRLNPLVGAVIETNPHAVAVAARRDEERRAGVVRGPMHGIPVLLKDNIAFKGDMETTAGSLALEGSKVPADATVASRLRSGGGGHPWQGQSVRMGELPRLRAVQRLERPRRLHARPVPPGLRPLRFELGVRRGAGAELLRRSRGQ